MHFVGGNFLKIKMVEEKGWYFMHYEKIQNIEEYKKILEDLNSFDPKIKITDKLINITPFYWNYVFVTNFVPIVGSLVAIIYLKLTIDYKLIFSGLILVSIYFLVWTQLKYYNRIIIDLASKTLTIFPNSIVSVFKKTECIDFSLIKYTTCSRDGFWTHQSRFIISITLENDKRIKLISSKEESLGKRIAEILQKVIHIYQTP